MQNYKFSASSNGLDYTIKYCPQDKECWVLNCWDVTGFEIFEISFLDIESC